LTVNSISTSGTRGQVTLSADGSITYDPRGRFDSLNAGQTDHDSFTYRVSDGHGGTDDVTVTVAISGKSDTERLVDSFEAPFLSQNRTSSIVTTVGQYQETDGARELYRPTDGQFMARLEAYGTTAQKVGSETISKLENFLGIPDRSLPKDPVDNTFPANGSAFKLKVSVQAGDEISFDWMFDARDFVNSPPDGKADDDFAIFTVAGGAGPELFKMSDIRQTGDQGATGWRSSIYKASAAADLTIGFGVVNDRIADSPREQNSFLLVDNVRLNRDFDQGYQLVDHQADGRFETVVHT
jgi:VCBS repeat-containing protein